MGPLRLAESPAPTAEQVATERLLRELDDYYEGLKQLTYQSPEEVFHWLSGVSARLTEIRAHLWRSTSNRMQAIRAREIDPLLEEIDRQFRVHSRLAAVASLEWEMTKGQPC